MPLLTPWVEPSLHGDRADIQLVSARFLGNAPILPRRYEQLLDRQPLISRMNSPLRMIDR